MSISELEKLNKEADNILADIIDEENATSVIR